MKCPSGLAYSMLAFAVLFTLLMTGSSCAGDAQLQAPTVSYQSVWAELFPDTLTTPRTPGTLQGDFYNAAAAGELHLAQRLWGDFLTRHEPADGVFEDGMHIRLVKWARLELTRLTHIAAGNTTAAALEAEKMQRLALE